MASLHTNNRPDSSNAFGVAQTTRPSNPTMERNTQTSVLIIANAHLPDSWISPKKANYAGRQDLPHNSLSQPSTESPHSVNLMRFIPDTGKPHPGYCYPHPTLPLWRFCSMAGKGLGSKRVEDVKMNRIDKLRAGRKRRAGRRPFVFKSSPLAEGQGVGRLTQFYANTYAPSSSSTNSSPFLAHKSTEGMNLHQTTFCSGRNTIRISRSSDPSSPTTKRWLDESQLEKPMTFPSLDRTNAYSCWSNQPQISKRCNLKPNKLQSPLAQSQADYQSWEISLPKCPFPSLGVFSN
ncbi:hypothetical protein PCANC_24313 [Puccinia coronata f. sp. avenae]|uniref:Uncharacterized protein n=1 Tax=Puccinia coronata f. sp. avenae TaxID=200324 RepID=A0A2N5TPJ6_9BASI|nr:hypothetical protein PCANC_24313 [Puccinia coronata f. sp. avenae]